MAIIAFIAGIIGFVMRSIEINTAMHGGVGLAEEWSFITIALTALTAAVMAGAAYFAVTEYKGKEDFFELRFSGKNMHPAVLAAGSALAGMAMYVISNITFLSPTVLIFAALGVFSAVSLWICTKENAFENNAPAKVLSIAPPVFCCLWLMFIYKDYSSEPQIIKFVYPCIAAAALTMAYYYSSGYFYEKGRPVETALFSVIAIYLSVTAAADAVYIWQMLLMIGFGGGAALNLVSIRKKKRQR